jgi:hypothetical protein
MNKKRLLKVINLLPEKFIIDDVLDELFLIQK